MADEIKWDKGIINIRVRQIQPLCCLRDSLCSLSSRLMARRSCRYIRPALLFGIINKTRPFLSDPSEGADNKDSVGSHTGSWQCTSPSPSPSPSLLHTHARFISSGNLAPIVEIQPSSGYHRNRSNGSLLLVRFASLLPPSPVATQSPQSLVRHGQRTSKLFKMKTGWC